MMCIILYRTSIFLDSDTLAVRSWTD